MCRKQAAQMYLEMYLALLVPWGKAQGGSRLCHVADSSHTVPNSLQFALSPCLSADFDGVLITGFG